MILFDTSVWIEHLRRGDSRLVTALEENRVAIHSAIIGELACGNIPDRAKFLADLLSLQEVEETSPSDTLVFISNHRLYGKGLGWIDMQLLASAVVSNAELVTYDRRLAKVVKTLRV